jgi:hypothetical protein
MTGTHLATDCDDEQRPMIDTRDTIVPVMIKQICQAFTNWKKGDNILIDGQPRKHVSLVGLIHSASRGPIAVTYQIDDGTGHIDVIDYPDGGSSPELQRETYCRVIGRLVPPKQLSMYPHSLSGRWPTSM